MITIQLRAAWAALPALVAAAAMSACANPKRVYEEPLQVMNTGDRIPSPDATVAEAASRAAVQQQATSARRDVLQAEALAGCAPAICEAVLKGELAIGMTEAQALAATRTTEDGWTIRRSGNGAALVPATSTAAVRDRLGEVALVQLANGRVAGYAYREPTGIRVVNAVADATPEARARATADALTQEGDALAAAGDFTAALDRYDRASILVQNEPMVQYRIATSLDKLLRPIEAQIRYRLFLQQLELQRIEAVGKANAQMADAIARAQQRLIVLERQAR